MQLHKREILDGSEEYEDIQKKKGLNENRERREDIEIIWGLKNRTLLSED